MERQVTAAAWILGRSLAGGALTRGPCEELELSLQRRDPASGRAVVDPTYERFVALAAVTSRRHESPSRVAVTSRRRGRRLRLRLRLRLDPRAR